LLTDSDRPFYAFYLHYTKLENVNVIKDLGVNFDPDLRFVIHCQEKINDAGEILCTYQRKLLFYYPRLLSDHNWNMLILYGIYTESG